MSKQVNYHTPLSKDFKLFFLSELSTIGKNTIQLKVALSWLEDSSTIKDHMSVLEILENRLFTLQDRYNENVPFAEQKQQEHGDTISKLLKKLCRMKDRIPQIYI